MVNYEELQQLVAFERTGTLAEVAEEFHISQPSITRNMKKIEAEFGVTLFNRSKNHVSLNEAGILAAKEAAVVVKQTDDMLKRVRDFDRANHTIFLGSCAAIPVPNLNRRIVSAYPQTTLSTDVRLPEELIAGLEKNTYQLIVLPFKPEDSALHVRPIGEEHLMFYLPKDHRLAKEKSLSLSDLNGENMLLFQHIGFWHDLVTNKMPDSHFLLQNERYTLTELISNSILPCFCTDVSLAESGPMKNRVSIPITDSEVNVTYYLVCKKENREKFSALF